MVHTALGKLFSSIKDCEPRQVLSSTAVLADVSVSVECEDEALFSEFFVMFGGQSSAERLTLSEFDISLQIHSRCHPDFGWFRMGGKNQLPVDAREFNLSIEQVGGLFELFPVDEPGWKCVAFRGAEVPAFAFHGRDCIFSLGPNWRRGIVSYLFWRLLRVRSDAAFFHASALGIFGEGTIFVGPSGAGKSTTSLALAARGHNFLSDEVAGYVPASGELIPFRRPVGIRLGPRSAAVSDGLSPQVSDRIAQDGFARVTIDAIFPVAPPQAIPLRRIVFLRGFATSPSLRRIRPGRSEMIALQPAMSSFLDVGHSRRVFELTQLLATAKVYDLWSGEPDETAKYLEKAFATE